MATPTLAQPSASRAVEAAQRSWRAGANLIASVLLAASGHLMIKHGLNTAPAFSQTPLAARILGYLLTPWVTAGLAVYGVGTLLWIAVAAKRDISYLYPITSLNYVLITVGGMWLFGETVPARRWLGILVVMSGVAALQISSVGRKS